MSARWGDGRPIVCLLAAAVLSVTMPIVSGAAGDEPIQVGGSGSGARADGLLLIDDFTDGNYNLNPAWSVVRATWAVTAGELWSSDFNQQVLTTPRTDMVGSWSFSFKLQAADGTRDRMSFFPISNNLGSDGQTNGYGYVADALGSDLSLVKRSGLPATDVKIITSTWTPDTNPHTGKVTRTSGGGFEIFLDGASKGTITDTSFISSTHVGLHFWGHASLSDHRAMIDDIAFTPVNPPVATVTAPNGGETWVGNSPQTISWTSALGDFPLKADSATLYWSTNGCGGAWTQIVAGQPVSGSYSWTVVNTPTNQACIRVTVEDDQTPANVGIDVSNGVFSIIAGNSPPAVAIVAPPAGGTLSGRTTFQWDASDANSNTVSYRIQLSQDSGGSWAQVTNVSYPETPTSARRSAPFDTTSFGDRTTYRLSIEANDGNGSRVWTNSTADWSIDNTDPACTMSALPPSVTNPQIPLAWNGTDAISGIAGYDMMVSEDGAPKWGFLWNSTNTSATFPGKDGVTYGFFCEPWDKAGNQQTKVSPDTTTTVDMSPPSSRVINMPPYVGALTFDVPFTVVDAAATSTVIHWRLAPVGAWAPTGPIPLPKGLTQGKGQVTVPGSGTYEFYSVATDATGKAESKPQVKEDETIVDLFPPTITASVLETLVAGNKVTITIDAHDDPRLDHVRVEFMPADGSAPWTTIHNFSGLINPDFNIANTPVTLTGATDGKQRVRAVAVDVARQSTPSAESEVTLDLTKPTVTSITPADGSANVPVAGPFLVAFSEEMETTSVLAAITVSGSARVTKIDWSGNGATLTLAGLSGNATYTLTVTVDARDVAGNRLARATEAKFTTIPTQGSLIGSLKEPGGAVVKGAVLQITLDGETILVNLSKDGSFVVDPLRAGKWMVHAEARGYVSLDTMVEVVVGEQGRAHLTMEKDQIPTLIGASVGVAVLGVVLFVVMRLLRKKCKNCGTVLPRSAKACSSCGQSLRQSSRLDVQRDARLAREAETNDQRKAIAAQYKLKKAKSGATGGPGVLMPAQVVVPNKPRPTNCLACRTAIKPEDEWCSKCGQAVGSGGECVECGGTIMDGACVSCGTPAGGAGVPTEKRVPCPRCLARLAPDAQICDECGHDLTRNQESKKDVSPARSDGESPSPLASPERAQTKAIPTLTTGAPAPSLAAPARPDMTPPPTSGVPAPISSCPTCGTPNPGITQWCDVCGEKVR